MKDTYRIVARIRSAKSSIADWKNILEACFHSLKMKEIIQTMPSNQLKIFEKVFFQLEFQVDFFKVQVVVQDELYDLAKDIHEIIDFEESKEAKRLIVRPGIFPELDDMKRTYEGLGDFLVTIF
jgi:DNA mismatch repair protein MSH5